MVAAKAANQQGQQTMVDLDNTTELAQSLRDSAPPAR